MPVAAWCVPSRWRWWPCTTRQSNASAVAWPSSSCSPAVRSSKTCVGVLTLGLKRADASEQQAIGRALSWVAESSTVPALLELLRGPAAVAQVAAASLRRLGSLAEPQLIQALHDGSTEERRALVPLLGGKSSARSELVACLEDDDATVRALSCDALARSSDPSVVSAIFPLLSDPDARVSQAALAATQSLGSDETRRLALEAARSSDARLQRAGLRIIGYFGYPEGLEALLHAANASDEKVREAAISGLPFLDDPSALSALLAASQHESTRTRTAAVRALGHTTGETSARERLRWRSTTKRPGCVTTPVRHWAGCTTTQPPKKSLACSVTTSVRFVWRPSKPWRTCAARARSTS